MHLVLPTTARAKKDLFISRQLVPLVATPNLAAIIFQYCMLRDYRVILYPHAAINTRTANHVELMDTLQSLRSNGSQKGFLSLSDEFGDADLRT